MAAIDMITLRDLSTSPSTMDAPLITLADCYKFVENQPASVIAERIIHDQSICRANGIPSLLVHCLPPETDAVACAISGDAHIPIAIARMRFASIVSGIKAHLTSLEPEPQEIPSHLVPSDEDFCSTLKVLRYLGLPQVSTISDSSTVSQLMEAVRVQQGFDYITREALVKKQRRQVCYICRFDITIAHKLYGALCLPCGDFNIASSALSLPSNLNLHGKMAVVTGGRINLGFHISLRLLRCGANVIISTRYPQDAQDRYFREPDAQEWKSRLEIVGADFRTAKDVFSLVINIKRCLEGWRTRKLDILINNAAQTLTDSLEKEAEHIEREQSLLAEARDKKVVKDNGYIPRVRGGQGNLLSSSERPLLERGPDTVLATISQKSSWVQEISDIPYEDVISAHSVNAFVPFILLRELLPLMRGPPQPGKPTGYVINVSSREGLPERRPGHSSKNGHHAHTNMSKAALNMLTETEAGRAWKRGRIAVNSVDPGYMSADPMWMETVGREGEECPIGWEDGAGRVLWVIAKGETDKVAHWGRFFKHFVEVESGRL